MKKSKASGLTGHVQSTPSSMLTGLEPALTVKGVELARDLTKDILGLEKAISPLNFVVKDSRFDQIFQFHQLSIVAVNNTRHGIYVDEFLTKEPANIEVRIYEEGIGKKGTIPSHAYFPRLISSGSPFEFSMGISERDRKDFKKKPVIQLQVTFTVLGDGKGPQNITFPIAIRWRR
jgi:hypothetical protein